MRKSLLVLLLGLTVAACGLTVAACGSGDPASTTPPTPPAQEDAVHLTEADAGQERTVRVGERFTITLPSNPSTGYTWRLAALDRAVVDQVGESDFRNEGDGPVLPGAGGVEVWTFAGNAAGTTGLALEYTRPWEHGVEPARTFTVTIEVE
ncbi:inhibitor of cysteine peptidase [Nocardia puris]|uniref:Inhibitor of cysteine peptidase n=1 Tax=Nocardia puris TaxID=208602 RepID=A0A366E6D8_9NOCA|nr:inhibitor of cysteine peptidase [Nocardia puris]